MDQPSGQTTRPWAEQSLGERIVLTAWRAVAAHLALEAGRPATPIQAEQQVATGGAGDTDGVTDDALLPPALRERLR